MNKTKIDWCDCTINPVVGCKNGCKYCYARKINDRFHIVKDFKYPEFFSDRLEQLKSKKSKSVFLDSMSDIGCWEDEWIGKVIEAIEENPQHNYIFLTKSRGLPYDLFYWQLTKEPSNVFFGRSITNLRMYSNTDLCNFDFWSIEPLLEDLQLSKFPLLIKPPFRTKTLIIGAETGNRKDKVIPQKEWVRDIVSFADKYQMCVFMKESLREIMGDEFRQDKLPWEVSNG